MTGFQVPEPLGPSAAANQQPPLPSQRRPSQAVTLNEQTQLRVAALHERMHGKQQTPQTGADFGTTNTTESLLHHEHGGGEPGEAKLLVGWQVGITTLS